MEEVPGFASQRGRGWTVQHTAACPIDPGGVVPSLWLERQIARCEGVAIIGLHACSRMAENSSSFAPCTMPAPGLFLPACQIHIQTCHGNHAAVTARRRAPMLPEAPVASREAKSLPGHLTCLPGRAAWGVWLPAPHVKDSLPGAGRSGTRILVLAGPDRVCS